MKSRPIRYLFSIPSLTNILTCTNVNLLTGTYGTLSIVDANGSLVSVGNVLLKLSPSGELYIGISATADYELVQIGAFTSCNANLLGLGGILDWKGISLSTCSPTLLGDWSLCQLVGGESYENPANLGSLKILAGLPCAAVGGLVAELGLAVQALVRPVGC